MDFDQLIKRLDWLDEERRKDKTSMASMEQRIQELETELKAARKKVKELATALQKNTVTPDRLDQWNTALTNQRSEIMKHIDNLEEKRVELNEGGAKRIQDQFKNIYNPQPEITKLRSSISDLKRQLAVLAEDDLRRTKELAEGDLRIQEIARTAEQVQRAQVILEESRKMRSSGWLTCKVMYPLCAK